MLNDRAPEPSESIGIFLIPAGLEPEIRDQLESLFAVKVEASAVRSDERIFRRVDYHAHEPTPPRHEFDAGEEAPVFRSSRSSPLSIEVASMPTECALDFRHVGDECRWLVVAPCLGTEMDEFTRVEMICYPLDDLAHGNAATCSDIVGAVRVRCRQQAHEQVGDIRCINKISNLTAVGHADRLTCAQCSQQGRNEAPWLVARPVWQKHARPGGGKAVTLGIGLDDHPNRRLALAIQRSRADRRCVLHAWTGLDVVFGGTAHADEALAAMFAERLDQSETGFQPIQVLGRIAVPVGRGNPGEVQQVGRPQLRDQPLRGSRDVQVEIVPGNPVGSIGDGGSGSPHERESHS